MKNIILLDEGKVTEEEFVAKCAGIHEGNDFPRNYLTWIYTQVKNCPLKTQHREKPLNVRYGEVVGGKIEFEAGLKKKTKHFIMGKGLLWGFHSKSECVPWGFLPLSGVLIVFESNLLVFRMTEVSLYKVSEQGQVKVTRHQNIVFRAKSRQWNEALMQLDCTRVLLN